MKKKRLAALVLGVTITASLLFGCGSSGEEAKSSNAEAEGKNSQKAEASAGEIIDFTMFSAMPGAEINDGNEIQELIAEKTGVRVKETWLTGQTDAEAIGTIIAGGEYPDFINGGEAMKALYDAGALVA